MSSGASKLSTMLMTYRMPTCNRSEMYTNSLTFVPQAVQNLTYLNWL